MNKLCLSAQYVSRGRTIWSCIEISKASLPDEDTPAPSQEHTYIMWPEYFGLPQPIITIKDEELKAMEVMHSKDQRSKREKKPMIHNGHTMEPWKDFPQVQKANHRLEGEEIHRNAYSIKQTFITLILFTMLKKLKSKKHRTFTTLGRWDDLVSKTFSLVKINYFYNQSEYYGRV